MTYGSFSTDLLFHPGAWGFVFPVESSSVRGELSLLPAAASAPDLCFAAVRRPVMLPHRMLRHHFAIGNQRGRHQALFYLLKHSRSKPREKTNRCQQADPNARKMQTTSRGEEMIDVPADRLHQELHVGSPLPLLTFISQSSPSNLQSLCKRRRLDSGFNSTRAARR